MITSSAHPDDDPRGEEVLVVGGTVVMTGERDLKVICSASPTQLLPTFLGSSKLTVRYRQNPNELLMTLLWLASQVSNVVFVFFAFCFAECGEWRV